MEIVLVQSTKKTVNGVNNTTLAYGSNLTVGNLVVNAHVHYEPVGSAISTPTDTLSHVYAPIAAEQNSDLTRIRLRSFYKENCSAGADTVTFDIVGAGVGDISLVIAEFSSIGISAALDQTQLAGPTNGTAVDSGATPTTTQADELLWGAMTHGGTDRTLTETGSATLVQENEGGTAGMPIAASYRVVSATGAYSATWTIGTGAVDWLAHVGTFKAAASATPQTYFPSCKLSMTQRIG